MSISDATYLWECDVCEAAEDHDSDRRPPRGFVQYNGQELCDECYGDKLREESGENDEDDDWHNGAD